MAWSYPFLETEINLRSDRVQYTDAQRQLETARAILTRLQSQPGVILGDEVGMGKTFVALTIAASVALQDRQRRPVIVMVPPSLQKKWEIDGGVFESICLNGAHRQGAKRELRIKGADSAAALLGLLDDPEETRAHVIVLRHGAMSRMRQDPWIKLAIIKYALSAGSLSVQRSAIPQYVERILNTGFRRLKPEVYAQLLGSPTTKWKKILGANNQAMQDDPVPAAVVDALVARAVDLSNVREVLAGAPLRASANLNERVKALRKSLDGVIPSLWTEVLRIADFTSPLLILDEAHHLKNARTRLASLFSVADDASEAPMLQGLLTNRFERMLFLTATPFQLGHHELLNVLERFKGITWASRRVGLPRATYDAQLDELRIALDNAYRKSTELDRRWSKLPDTLLVNDDGTVLSPDAWWSRAVVNRANESDETRDVIDVYGGARAAMKNAEELLQPWIVRHRRPLTFGSGGVNRRDELDGEAICGTGRAAVAHHPPGIGIGGDALLPFLLAARAHVIAEEAARAQRGTAAAKSVVTFADGLASSYEAFLETRRGRSEGLDEDCEETTIVDSEVERRIKWYAKNLEEALPDESSFGEHPKLKQTVGRVCDLWDSGEKVVVFCHWKATGRALQGHISRELEQRLRTRAARDLNVATSEVDAHLERIGSRFDDAGSLRRALDLEVARVLDRTGVQDENLRRPILEIVRRFARTPSFIVRYLPLDRIEEPNALSTALGHSDTSGLALQRKIEEFVRFIAKRTADERNEYLAALTNIQTGNRYVDGVDKSTVGRTERILANVRLVNGEMKREDRRNVLLAFNTPFFPEILIATSVLAEGVDLHLDCRHIIHHDLAWNPSTLEQRTGRIDRIGSKAERTLRSIQVYHPYIGECQDEKMYKVVMDRRRWFQVLMGSEYMLDTLNADTVAARIPLPSIAASDLAFHLEVASVSGHASLSPSVDIGGIVSGVTSAEPVSDRTVVVTPITAE